MAESGGGEEEEEVRFVVFCTSQVENTSNVRDFINETIVPTTTISENAESTSMIVDGTKHSDDDDDRHGLLRARYGVSTNENSSDVRVFVDEMTEGIIPTTIARENAESSSMIVDEIHSDDDDRHGSSRARLGSSMDESVENIVEFIKDNNEITESVKCVESTLVQMKDNNDRQRFLERFVNTDNDTVPVIVVKCPITDDIQHQEDVVSEEQQEDDEDEEEGNEQRTVTGPVQMVKKVLLPTRYNPLTNESPSTSNSRSLSSPNSSSSSVLRTLLQASGKQLMLYQTHKHQSERFHFTEGIGSKCGESDCGGGGRNGSGESELSRTTSRKRWRLQPRRRRPSSSQTKQILKYSVGSQTFPAGIHTPIQSTKFGCREVEREKIPEENMSSSSKVNTSGTTSSSTLLSRQINSQIKALLLGHDYIRDERTTTTVPCQRVDEQREDEVDREKAESDEEKAEDDDAVESRIEDSSSIKRRRLTEDSILPIVISDAMKIVAEFKDLSFSVQHGQPCIFLEVRRKGLYGIPSPGTVPAQVVIDEEGMCRFLSIVGMTEEVHCTKSESGDMSLEELRPLLHKLSISGGHVFCPGVKPDLVDAVPNVKNVVYVGTFPQRRYQSKDCSVWYMLSPSQSWLPLNRGVHTCKPCKQLERYLWSLKKAKERLGTESLGVDVAHVGNADFVCVWGSTEGVET